MCREILWWTDKCNRREGREHKFPDDPPRYSSCVQYLQDKGDTRPGCIEVHRPLVKRAPKRHQCKGCQRPLEPKNLARDATVFASDTYQRTGAEQVALPQDITQRMPRQFPGLDDNAALAPEYSNQRAARSVRTANSRPVSPFPSTRPSSTSQSSEAVYDADGKRYDGRIGTPYPEPAAKVEEAEGELLMFYNDPNIDDEMREEMGPALEDHTRDARWLMEQAKKAPKKGPKKT